MINENSQQLKLAPKDFVLEPDSEVPLLNILNRLKRLEKAQNNQIKIQENQLKIQQEQMKLLGSISEQQLKLQENQQKLEARRSKIQEEQTKLLSVILKTNEDNLKIQEMTMDEGGRLPIDNIVGSGKFLIVDVDDDPGHPVKGFFIKNNGPNPIYVSDNENIFSPSIEDVKPPKGSKSRFYKIDVDQEKERHINVPRITDIYIIQDPDIKTGEVSSLTGELVW